MAKLLVVDDEKNLRLVVQKELSRQGHEVETASDGEEAWEALEGKDFDVLLCDINMPRLDGIGLLRRMREKSQTPPEVIMLTGQATVETAIEAMKLGAYDYLTKPYRLNELAALVTQADEKQQLKIDNQRLRAQIERTNKNLPEIVAESPQMKEVLRLVRRVAPRAFFVVRAQRAAADPAAHAGGQPGERAAALAENVRVLPERGIIGIGAALNFISRGVILRITHPVYFAGIVTAAHFEGGHKTNSSKICKLHFHHGFIAFKAEAKCSANYGAFTNRSVTHSFLTELLNKPFCYFKCTTILCNILSH